MTNQAIEATDVDLEQIRRLTHDYAWAIDNSQLDDLVDLFTEDAAFDMRALGAPAAFAGAAELREGFQAMIDGLGGCVHLTMNHLLDVSGDSGTGQLACHAFVLTPDGGRTENLLRYEDTYVRGDAGWKFSSRVISPLLAAPAA